MIPTLISEIKPDELSRCEERRQVTDHGISLDPTQKADAAIKGTIDVALSKDVKTADYDEIDVRVKSGFVYLDGHIMNSVSRRRIEAAIRTIPGVLGIRNKLVLDDSLTLEVAASLVNLEHAYACKFFTGTAQGVVSLNGVVANEKVRLLAEKRAAANPNVRGVINNVRLSGTRLRSQIQPFLQPAMGETIYFRDGIAGVVKHVIINPNNRLVIAMILQGSFTDPQYELRSLADGRVRLPERLVSVSMNLVRYLTKASGFLTIHSSERKRYMDFDPGIFFAPNNGWVPPYPYCPGDVLIPIEYQNADEQVTHEPDAFPFGAVLEDASVREQFFATDSFGV